MGQKIRYSMTAELANAERMHSGARIRLSVAFSQEDLRLLAGAGYELDAGALRAFVRDSAVATALDSIHAMRERWTLNDAVWVCVDGRAFDAKGRPIGPKSPRVRKIRVRKLSPGNVFRTRAPRAR